MALSIPVISELENPLLGFRFGVFFLGKVGISHPLDFRFQSVSGLEATVELTKDDDSGSASGGRELPDSVKYSNLTLKRGMPLISTLSIEIQKSLSQFRFSPRNILVSVLDENILPLNSWIFSEAFPVKWSLSSFDAESSGVIIEEMELKYKSFKSIML